MLRALSIDRKPESRTRLTVLHSYLPASGLREAEPALPLGAWPLPVRRQVGDHRDLRTDYVPTGADSGDVEVTRSVGAPDDLRLVPSAQLGYRLGHLGHCQERPCLDLVRGGQRLLHDERGRRTASLLAERPEHADGGQRVAERLLGIWRETLDHLRRREGSGSRGSVAARPPHATAPNRAPATARRPTFTEQPRACARDANVQGQPRTLCGSSPRLRKPASRRT